MKIRKGFVSNSSSSSFIIGVKLNKEGKIEIDPYKLGDVIKTEKELIEKLTEYGELDKLEKTTEYKYLKKGKIAIRLSVPYDACEDFEELLKSTETEYNAEEN